MPPCAGASVGARRRAEKAFLGAWEASRPRKRPRHLGADEIQRGKGQKYWTVLSDLVHGEVIGLAQDRTEDALKSLLLGQLDARQRSAVEAVCTDMHHPYVKAVTEVLPHAAVVFDKFHVLQHAANALDKVRRQEFFRTGPVMRQYGRGKRWLLLHRWRDVRGSKRRELQELFAANRRLFKAYVLARTARFLVDVQDASWGRLLPRGLAARLEVAAPPRDEQAGRVPGTPLRQVHRSCWLHLNR